jgi:CheY-like chemotaxis protein/HPt (histidine-containing phosphotransfer) domain-containing protein
VSSVPGVGTVFRCKIRLAPRAQQPFVVAQEVHGLSALVIEDNASVRLQLYRWLSAWGMSCDLAEDCAEAGELVRSNNYRVAVIDATLPDGNGLDLIAGLRDKNPHAAILFLVPFGDQRLTTLGLQAGATVSVDKPLRERFVHDALVSSLGLALDKKHAVDIQRQKKFSGRVLVAEDNAVNLRITIAQLARIGLQADVASNGLEAVTAINQFPYDVVLMDCHMPDMDGYQATQIVRERETALQESGSSTANRRIIIIAMTANAMAGDRERCLAAGMDDYVAKPVRLELLTEVLSRYLPSQEEIFLDAPAIHNEPAKEAITPTNLIEEQVLERMRREIGEDSVFSDVVNIFMSDTPSHVQQLEQAVQQNDQEETRRLAHKLKGSCHIIGARQLGQLCIDIEAALRDETPEKNLQYVRNIRMLLDDTLQQLQQCHQRVIAEPMPQS